jgi:hypothetical protein
MILTTHYFKLSVYGPKLARYLKAIVSESASLTFTVVCIDTGIVDGHRKAIVEHTLNILFLPGIHHDEIPSHIRSSSSLSLATTSPHPTAPSLHLPMTSLCIPSPLHLRLHIITRFSFNEQGRITHHRDFWDVKDVLGLVPGLGLAQWITSRIAARSISFAGRLLNGGRSANDSNKSRPLSWPQTYGHYAESMAHTRTNSRAGSERGNGDWDGAKIVPTSGYSKNLMFRDGVE